jgi:uncharacterized protein with FMN-binding domain
MKKLFISLAFIGAFVSYVFYNNSVTNAANASSNAPVTTVTDSSAANVAVSTTNTTSNADTSNSVPASTPAQTPVTTPSPATTPVVVKKTTTGQYVDGNYTGSVADAYYGNVQVRVTVSGGKITKIAFLQYPNDRSTSISINRRATPVLAAEAIQAQSANVSGVSGASDTSMAFQQSLGDALSQAKA